MVLLLSSPLSPPMRLRDCTSGRRGSHPEDWQRSVSSGDAHLLCRDDVDRGAHGQGDIWYQMTRHDNSEDEGVF